MNKTLKYYNILIGIYGLNIVWALLSSVPMLLHVSPFSKCLIFSYEAGGDLHHGNYLICLLIGYGNVLVLLGNIIILIMAIKERHKIVSMTQSISQRIFIFHCLLTTVVFTLVIFFTAGYSIGCGNLSGVVMRELTNLMGRDPSETLGEDVRTLFEDNYKFHRYTERYGNKYGLESFQPRVTCRTIYSDPEIHQRLHDSHVKKYANHFGYFYQTDIQAYSNDATYTNSLVEASLVGSWLCFFGWLLTGIFVFWARKTLKREKLSAFQDNVSTSDQNFVRKGSNHSIYSGKSSTRRDIDDVALSLYSSKAQLGAVPMDGSLRRSFRGETSNYDPRLSARSFGATDVETEIF